jgi:hypothetical protein
MRPDAFGRRTQPYSSSGAILWHGHVMRPQVELACTTWGLSQENLRVEVSTGSAEIRAQAKDQDDAAAEWSGITFCRFRSMFRMQATSEDGTRHNRYYRTIDLAVPFPMTVCSVPSFPVIMAALHPQVSDPYALQLQPVPATAVAS